MPASLVEVVRQADRWLTPERFTDYDGAVNGLQFENRGQVTRIAAAVDATYAVLQKVAATQSDLVVVHHGLFWSKTVPWTGRRAELLRWLVERDLAVYSMHLPLDAHPTLGNCALLGRALGFKKLKPFFWDPARPGQFIGWQTDLAQPLSRTELANRLGHLLGRAPIVLAGGEPECRRIGICTGGAGSQLSLARQEGVDAFVTGEGPHWTHGLAEDLGLNVFYGGHYATETFGVKALAAKLARHFKVPWEFVDHPSGL